MATRTPGRGYDHLPEHRRRIYTHDRCTDFDDLLEEALAHGKTVILTAWPDGTPITDAKDGWKLLGKIANTRKGKTVSVLRNDRLGLGPVLDGGTWTVRMQIKPKDQGRDYIAGQLEAGEPVPYNPAVKKAKGKYICPGCRHRRSAAPKILCLDCAAGQATTAARQFARQQAAAAKRAWGEGWEDPGNWEADHALIPPRTPREKAARPVAEQAREHIDLEQRIRQATGQLLGWQEAAPRPPRPRTLKARAAAIPRTVKAKNRQAADRHEAERIEGPYGDKIRQMLDQWTNGQWD